MQTNHTALLNACKAVDADIELTGKVSAASVEMVRKAIATADGNRKCVDAECCYYGQPRASTCMCKEEA